MTTPAQDILAGLQGPWWITIPGMNWRVSRRWPDRPVAAAACAMACTARLVATSDNRDPDKLRKYFAQAGRLRKWLESPAADADAWLRRYALCLATDLAPAGLEPRYLIDYADLLLCGSS